MTSPRRFVIALGCLFLVAGTAAATPVLIITKDSKSIRADSARKDETSVYYMPQGEDTESSITLDRVDQLLPIVERGRHYKPSTIAKMIEVVGRSRSQHPNLQRKITPIFDQWQSLQKSNDEVPGLQAQAVDAFMRDKGTAAYKDAIATLQMLKFKDLRGAYDTEIEGALEQIKYEYFSHGMATLRNQQKDPGDSIHRFITLKKLADDLLAAKPPVALRAEIEQLRDKRQRAVYKTNLRQAKAMFNEKKSINNCIKACEVLHQLQRHVATDGNDIDSELSKIQTAATRANPDYYFKVKGYPLSQEDMRLLKQHQQQASRTELLDRPGDVFCFLIPEQRIPPITIGRNTQLRYRAIFKRWPGDGEYAFVVRYLRRHNQDEEIIPVELPTLRDGHGTLTINSTFEGPKHGIQAKTKIYGYLARKPAGPGLSTKAWQPVSLACRMQAR
jgi:hypothetical protein